MIKSQINFRLPETLIAALKERAESEGITSTELAIRLLETGLGLPSSELAGNDQRIEQRIASQLAPLQEQIIQLNQSVEGRITARFEPLQQQVLGLSQCLSEHIATQLVLAQEQLDERTERIHKRIEDAIQSKLDAELEKSDA